MLDLLVDLIDLVERVVLDLLVDLVERGVLDLLAKRGVLDLLVDLVVLAKRGVLDLLIDLGVLAKRGHQCQTSRALVSLYTTRQGFDRHVCTFWQVYLHIFIGKGLLSLDLAVTLEKCMSMITLDFLQF